MPLRDKVGLSESSISKIPTAYQWGQILQPCCARQLPLLKEAPPFGRPSITVRFLDCARNDRVWKVDRAFPILSFRPKRVARSGEISERQRRTKCWQMDCAAHEKSGEVIKFPAQSKAGLGAAYVRGNRCIAMQKPRRAQTAPAAAFGLFEYRILRRYMNIRTSAHPVG